MSATLVTQKNFQAFLDEIKNEKEIGFDTETTTLFWWDSPHIPVKPRVFAMQFAVEGKAWYLDFEHSEDKLTDEFFPLLQRELFSNPDILWFIHNAKFDMHHSANHGVAIAGTIHDTSSLFRLINNLEPSLKLDALCKKYLGVEKVEVDAPATKIKKWGQNETMIDLMHFDQIPFDKLFEYGIRDTELVYKLGKYEVQRIHEINDELYSKISNLKTKSIIDLLEKERTLTKVLFEMERHGVQIDLKYAKAAYYHEIKEYEEQKTKFEKICAQALNGKILDPASPKQLKELFDALGERYEFTEKGNTCFDADALENSEAEVAKIILKFRYHYKRAHTYFENYVWFCDKNGILHCDFQQGGTSTGRMSCWSPNLQNVSKNADKEETEFPVRRCFVPRKGKTFLDKDYKTAEYNMMIDYAGEMSLIDKVKAGLDVHDATKEELGASNRFEAKTLNFMLLYGGGYAKLASALKIKVFEAKKKKYAYFAKLPRVKQFIFKVRDMAAGRGFIVTWSGRKLDYEANTAFKAPNGLIQGGVGDMAKHAMISCAEILKGKKTKMLLQVHDSILFELEPGEEYVGDELGAAMKSIYPFKHLSQDVDSKQSEKSWGDLE